MNDQVTPIITGPRNGEQATMIPMCLKILLVFVAPGRSNSHRTEKRRISHEGIEPAPFDHHFWKSQRPVKGWLSVHDFLGRCPEFVERPILDIVTRLNRHAVVKSFLVRC